MAQLIIAPRGTKDVFGEEVSKWQFLEKKLREVCERFGYTEVRIPTFEHTELFARGVGDTTDIVGKEMYTFSDKGERSITLRPEGTSGVARAFLQNGVLNEALPVRAYYILPCFRYEKPQAGRYREFHQLGIEMFGSPAPDADCEAIRLAATALRELGIKNVRLEINSIGCKECRPKYRAALTEHFKARESELCDTCRDRLTRNPLRILDCKSPV
ncbi:MAG: histidine--tRNA ligase, partial [Ruminococcaceae bacterium]|nr:histidine--tRNA ligase [Oscillospiraceae bacterium]